MVLTLQLSFCGGASLLLLRPLRLGSSLLRARVTARSLRPRSFFRSDSFLFLSEIYPSTKARKGDGEYVRLIEEAGKHENGDIRGHSLT